MAYNPAKGSLAHRMKLLLVLLAFGLLSSCYITPGQFTAHLHIGSDGSFTYRYIGEIRYHGLPESRPQAQWDDRAAFCLKEGTAEPRVCRPDEIVAQRATHENAWQGDLAKAAELARLTGINVFDDAANRRIAAQLLHYKGWKKAAYKGNAIFEVEYEMTDSLSREFAFPSLPSAQMLVPFLTVYPTTDRQVRIEAAGMTSGIIGRMIEGNRVSHATDRATMFAGLNGTLHITTDAEIQSTNGLLTSGNEISQVNWTIRSGAVVGMAGDAPHANVQLP